MDLISLSVAVVLALSAGAAVYAFWRTQGVDAFRAQVAEVESHFAQLRGDFSKLVSEVQHAHDEQRREYKRLADEAEELYERAERARARADGRRGGGRPPAAAPEPPPRMSREQYLAQVERTGRADPDIERALGF